MAEDFTIDNVQANAADPAKMTVDGESAEQFSLKDQLEVANAVATQKVAANPMRALRFAKFSNPGTI